MSNTEQREIIMTIGDTDFSFNMTPQDVTKYFNTVTPNNKVAPSNNLLTNTVKQEQLATLRPFLRNPVMTMQLAGALLEEYAPDVEIVVKKPSTAPTA